MSPPAKSSRGTRAMPHAAPPCPTPPQSGVALLTALLVVALVTVSVVAAVGRENLLLRRTANLLHGDQALVYALGAEAWAGRILARDRTPTDFLGEDWALRLPPTPVEGGMLSGRLEDAQGRFNLNNLLDAQGRPSAPDIRRFQRLLRALELSPELAQAAVDWIDPDLQPQLPGGAEDYAYLGQKPAYRAGNTPLRSPSELRLLAGLDQAGYERLRPYVTALPERTPINVNTAPPAVLQCLAEGLNVYQAESLAEQQQDKGFASVEAFFQHPALAGLEVDKDGAGVASRYFILHAQADIERGRARLTSLLYRAPAGVVAVARSLGEE